MPILVSAIQDQVASILDAQGNDYFSTADDYVPSINRAQQYLTSIINSILGGKKFAEEQYRDLTEVMIFQTSNWSRISLVPSNGDVVWDILNVVPNPVLNTPFVPISVPNGLSAPLPSYFYVSGGNSCDRKNVNEWTQDAGDPFSGSYNMEPNGNNLRYGYVAYTTYWNNLFTAPSEIEIRPYVPVQAVAVFFVKMPPPVAALGDLVSFPPTFMDVMVKATLREICIKQGGGGAQEVIEVAERDIKTYISSYL